MKILNGPSVALVVVLGVTSLGFTRAESAPAGSTTASLLVEVAAGVVEDCILWCEDAFLDCEENEHDAWWVASDARNDFGEGHHPLHNPCRFGSCEGMHPACIPGGGGGGGHLVTELLRGVDGDDTHLIRMAMASLGPDEARFVPERSALQVVGCGDRVVLHLPVSEELARQLVE